MADIYLYKYGDTTKYKLSKANRKFSVDEKKLGKTQVLAAGNKVRDIITTKRTFKISWEWLPHLDWKTADGGIGFAQLLNLYEYGLSQGELTVDIPNGEGGFESVNVFMGENMKAEMQRLFSKYQDEAAMRERQFSTISRYSPAGSNYVFSWSIDPDLLVPGDILVMNSAGYSQANIFVGMEYRNPLTALGVRNVSVVEMAMLLKYDLKKDIVMNDQVIVFPAGQSIAQFLYWNVDLELIEV